MSFITKCIQVDNTINLKFEKSLDQSSFNLNNFSLNGANLISLSGSGDEVNLEFEEVSRPIVVNCSVLDIDSGSHNISRMVGYQLFYKNFNDIFDLINYAQGNIQLSDILYYDSSSCKIYYDEDGQNLASDLTGFLLVKFFGSGDILKSIDLSSGLVTGWEEVPVT